MPVAAGTIRSRRPGSGQERVISDGGSPNSSSGGGDFSAKVHRNTFNGGAPMSNDKEAPQFPQPLLRSGQVECETEWRSFFQPAPEFVPCCWLRRSRLLSPVQRPRRLRFSLWTLPLRPG